MKKISLTQPFVGPLLMTQEVLAASIHVTSLPRSSCFAQFCSNKSVELSNLRATCSFQNETDMAGPRHGTVLYNTDVDPCCCNHSLECLENYIGQILLYRREILLIQRLCLIKVEIWFRWLKWRLVKLDLNSNWISMMPRHKPCKVWLRQYFPEAENHDLITWT